MQYSQIPRLYEPKVYFDDPLVELYSKTQGGVKIKKEKSLLGGLKNPGSLKRYWKFHHKGRVLVSYEDCPLKYDSKPTKVIYMQEIKEILENAKGKLNLAMLVLENDSLCIKFDSPKEMEVWTKPLKYLQDFYKNEKLPRARSMNEEIDMEACLKIMSENEFERWQNTKENYDYTLFFKDKGLLELFTTFSISQMSNRVLVGQVSKKTKRNKVDSVVGSGITASKFSKTKQSVISHDQMSPSTPTRKINKTFFEKIDTFGYKNYTGFLISQTPVSQIDEEFYFKDLRTIHKPDFLKKFEFNTLYLFDYSGPGDIRFASKQFAVE